MTIFISKNILLLLVAQNYKKCKRKTSKGRNKKLKKQLDFCLLVNFYVLFLLQRKGDH